MGFLIQGLVASVAQYETETVLRQWTLTELTIDTLVTKNFAKSYMTAPSNSKAKYVS